MRRLTNVAPDARLAAALGVLRRSARTRDRGPYAQCATLISDGKVVHRRYVRYLAPGITGGKVFIVPVSGTRGPPLPRDAPASARRWFTDPAVCLVTVGYLGTMSGVGGCVPLVELRRNSGFGASTEIVDAPQEQLPLIAAGFPPDLRRGSIVSGVFADRVASVIVRYGHEHPFTVRVHDNYAQFHTIHSAPVAATPAAQTLIDAHGRLIRKIHVR